MAISGLIEEIYEEVNQRLKNATQSVAKKSDKRVKEIRNQIINDWFYPFDGLDFSAYSNNLVQKSFNFGNLSAHIEIDSWTESSQLPEHRSAERWRGIHGGGQPSNEYVADLIFDQGIIGLPEFSSIPHYNGPGWINGHNLHFHQKEPLSMVIEDSELWDAYMDEVEEEILSKMSN